MSHYELLKGRHVENDGTIYAAGDIVEVDYDLVQMFGKDKFRCIGKSELKVKLAQKADEAGEETEDESDYPGPVVTEEFPGAEDAGVIIVKQGKKFIAYDANGDAEPLTDLMTKKQMTSYVAELEADADEDEELEDEE